MAASFDVYTGNPLTDRADFLADVGALPLITQDFETYSHQDNLDGVSIAPGVSVTSNMDNVVAYVPLTLGDVSLFGYPRQSGIDDYYDITLDPAQGYTAVGFDIVYFDPDTPGPGFMGVVFADLSSVSFPVFPTNATEEDPVFFGIISDTPIVHIQWTEGPEIGGGGNEETGLDDFVFAASFRKTLTSGPDRDGSISYPDFVDAEGLTLNGEAEYTGGVLRLVPALTGQAGSAFTTDMLELGPGGSFNTRFSFQISDSCGISDLDGQGADGITFILQTSAAEDEALGFAGGSMGYGGISDSFAIEFDTWFNGAGLGDPDGNHIGMGIDGAVGSGPATPVGPPRMNDGAVFYAWIDFDGAAGMLEVRLSTMEIRPAAPTFMQGGLDLVSILGGTAAHVGFTSATGSACGNHDILSWTLDGAIDLVVPINVETPTAYDFTIRYNDPNNPSVVIEDYVPAEWDVTHIEFDDTGLPVDCGEATEFVGDYGMVDVYRGGKSGKKCNSDTGVQWMPDLSAPGVVGFYWTDGWTSGPLQGPPGTVNYVTAADGSDNTVLATQADSGALLSRVTDVEIDYARNVVYFTNWFSGAFNASADEAIYRMDLDGANQVLFSNSNNATFASALHRLAVDSVNGDVYFTRSASYAGTELSRVDVNGANYTMLQAGEQFYSGIALDDQSDLVYYGNGGGISTDALKVFPKAGGVPVLLEPGTYLGSGKTIAFDEGYGDSGTVFYGGWLLDFSAPPSSTWSGPANGGGKIYAYDVHTGVSTLIVDDPVSGIPDIEVDTVAQRIYWTDYVRGEIRSANYDGSDVTTEVSGLVNPFGLALEFGSVNDTLNVQTEARCHENRDNNYCRPTSCGALYLNTGAVAIDKATGAVVAGPTEPICLAAVDDVNLDGKFTWDGSGDEDGDNLTDLEEACEYGTDPCMADTDEDGVDDGEDSCPLRGDEGNGLDATGCPIVACVLVDNYSFQWNLLLEGDGTIVAGSTVDYVYPTGASASGYLNPEGLAAMSATNNTSDGCTLYTDGFDYDGACGTGSCSGTWVSYCSGSPYLSGSWTGTFSAACEISNPDAGMPAVQVSTLSVLGTGGDPALVQ